MNQGDSGGPLFIETDPNRNEIVGTVSFGDGCARPFPGIYAKVATAETLAWINDYTESVAGTKCSDPPRSRRSMQADEFSNELYDELADESNDRKFLYPGVYNPYVVPYYRQQNSELADELADETANRKLLYPGIYSPYIAPYYKKLRRQNGEQSDFSDFGFGGYGLFK